VTMNDVNINVNFGSVDGLTEKFWARIEVQPPESDFVSLSDAATVIDSIYDIDPCNEDSALVGGQEAKVFEEEEVEPLLSVAFGSISYDPCKYDANSYSYEATLYIYRSHFDIPYKLVINDGTILSTEVVEKTIETLVFPEERKIEVDYPIVGHIKCDEEIVSFVGARALLKNDYTKHLSFSYLTKYDKVTIKVNGTDSEAQDAKCIVFYKEIAYSENVSKPTEDATAVNLLGCNPISSTNGKSTPDESEEPTDLDVCYQRYIYSQICQCSGNIKDSYSVVAEVPCPDSPATPHSDTEQGALNFWWQARHINTYVPCYEEETWEGSEEDFYVDNCCVSTVEAQVSLPSCEVRTSNWLGGAGIIKGPDFHLDNAFHDERVILVGVGPEDGVCGTIKYVQEVNPKGCCDSESYDSLLYDEINSVDTIAPDTAGMVYWTGGFVGGLTTVSVNGEGFYLDPVHSKTTIITTKQYVTLYADMDACGMCVVNIEDICSDTSGSVRSTAGGWGVAVEYSASLYPRTFVATEYSGSTAIAYEGKYKYSQNVYTSYTLFEYVSEACGPVCPTNGWDIYAPGSGAACAKPITSSYAGWSINGVISVTLAVMNAGEVSFPESEDACGFLLNPEHTPYCKPSTIYQDCYPECTCQAGYGWKMYNNAIYVQEWIC